MDDVAVGILVFDHPLARLDAEPLALDPIAASPCFGLSVRMIGAVDWAR